MASKRDLKKQINYVCGETAVTCIITRDCMKVNDPEGLEKLVVDIARLKRNSIAHVNFSFDKQPHDFDNRAEYRKALHAYRHKAYNSLIQNFNAKLNDILKQLNGHIAPEQLQANKEALK